MSETPAGQDGSTPATPPGVPPGQILAGTRLRHFLETEDKIFRSGSWDADQIKGAGYELRLAGDLLVLPLEPGGNDYRRIRKGDPRVDEIHLAPGDSALISTVEKFSMDFDVSCLIGPKFRWAAKGVLMLQGMVAHPGYGREQDASGEWIPKDDERLYLVIANIGPNPVYMRRGDPIAYVQFFEVERTVDLESIPNLGFDYLTEALFGSDSSGLAYFRNIRELARRLDLEEVARAAAISNLHSELEAGIAEQQKTHDSLRTLIERHRDERDQKLEVMRTHVSSVASSIDRVRSATDNVVVFGVFLVAATILGVVVTTLISVVTKLPDDLTLWKWLIIGGVALLYAILTIVAIVLVAKSARRATLGPETVKPGGKAPNGSGAKATNK